MTRPMRRTDSMANIWVVMAGLWLGGMANSAGAAQAPEWPKVPGAVFAMRDGNPVTPVVALDAKGRDLMAFNCAARGRSLLGRNHELFCDGGSFVATDAGTWIGTQVAKSGMFTFEAMLTPAEVLLKTPGVVLAYGDDQREDAALVQDKSGLSLRLGGVQLIPLFLLDTAKPVHIVIACGKNQWSAYCDGKPCGSGPLADGGPAWGTRQFVMGAAWSGAEPWHGRMEAVAVFPKSLSAADAAAQAAASKLLTSGRKPASSIRFTGTLVRQAKTSELREIRPYTRSLTAAEYKVEKVLAGEWKEPTITVLHWMIMDGKRLSIADREVGAKVQLNVDPLSEHPELESSRRDEMTDGELIIDPYYCESEATTKVTPK